MAVQIAELISSHFPLPPTRQQHEAFTRLADFLNYKGEVSCFVLKGYAGTGKTTIISTLVSVLPAVRIRSVLLAPTGRAAKVMSNYAGKKAYTIHKKIYRKKVALSPEMAFGMANNPHSDTLFIVDEASMISNERLTLNGKSVLEDLIEYVNNGENCRLLFVGDTAQLPPVGLQQSPALDSHWLARVFAMHAMVYELTDVVRQEKDSGILHNATTIRMQMQSAMDKKAALTYPRFIVKGYPDIYRMTGEHLIEGLHYAYGKYGMENTIVICRSNKNANLYNQHIRNRILFREEELTGGDHIMVVRNNYHWLSADSNRSGFIANGDMAQVRRVRNVHDQHGFRFADVSLEFMDSDEIEPVDCRVMLDTLHSDTPNLSQADQRRLFEAIMADYADIPDKRERLLALKADPYYNALQIKFAMAITCHKAQGGQWQAVFVDQGYLTEELLDIEFLRWLYTACTRATKELFLVNFNDKFFG
ncbi:ATP-dependent endonuclease [Parapedobacter pyrenivorans]|uniref:ATP-dependent endonuclease n=1 Tax=Parapedobacter pyrenivorans TaxID=1305674 RepID=A0A917HZA6_9SPHI|nr:ATP-dependent endonuclease [Parapedobacter pyrenivorans]